VVVLVNRNDDEDLEGGREGGKGGREGGRARRGE
jgi:hypothetical protein